jgi:hypothetical protein
MIDDNQLSELLLQHMTICMYCDKPSIVVGFELKEAMIQQNERTILAAAPSNKNEPVVLKGKPSFLGKGWT